ncbi:glyoxylase-like metal-dependent hydrolase (beta-lactamase superfamily II) [Evansella vedderi]|uniref:Glyoxylase-like metal-dependent hydrolase (Beta-lactamase superfamily II) n=1 Tax=Evansella vedderi TaxID=38282 RepID=A0ABT9ZWC4_9BACI|nr:MBL fold metallo-hydrolase [Evansella vedderi]MDQ0254425.1 glyoxylase-like metal-dependent hydrolase (beta-lactamase superfamily II) [Evansella vedderi]
MKWKQLPLGPLQTNGYILYNDNGSGVIIDPGGNDKQLLSWLKEKDITILAILLTHAHFDHIGAVDTVRTTFNAPVYLHKKEAHWLTDPQLNGSGLFQGIEPISTKKADHLISAEGPLEIGGIEFQIFETPGHSPGSVSFYLPEESIVFSGDVLFRGGVGRTDLPGGDEDTLINSIHNKMLSLPDETIVANGHGPLTTIGEEKETNPFINGFGW